MSEAEVRALPLAELVDRMDAIRRQAYLERYPLADPATVGWMSIGKVVDLLDTLTARNMSDPSRRRLADAAFRFLLQMDFLMAASGISNTVLVPMKWSSPRYWTNAGALAQYEIIASRIALECFFDLIHISDTGERMPDKKGKFKAFRAWVLKPGNRFKYFVGHIVHAFHFDRQHRQREVHGTSRFALAVLRLQQPDPTEVNIPNQLTNVVLNVWDPLLLIMNGEPPHSISAFSSSDAFAEQYFRSLEDSATFDSFLTKLLADMASG